MGDEMSELPTEFREYPERRILYVERRADAEGSFNEAAPGAIHALMEYVQTTDVAVRFETFMGITPDDMLGDRSNSRYWAAMEFDGEASDLLPNQDVHVGTLAPGRELVYVHRGAYADLPEAWMALERYRAANNIPFRGPAYEVYVDNPSATSEAELRTELRMPVHEVYG